MITYCRAKGCSNKVVTGRKTGRKMISASQVTFFPIPDPKKNPRLCKQWLHNLGTGIDFKTYKFRRYNTVCEEHFEEDAFVENIRAKVLNLPWHPKLLKSDAVPTIFAHRKIPKRRLGTERRLEAKRKREMIDKLLKEHVERKVGTEQIDGTLQQVVIKKEPGTNFDEGEKANSSSFLVPSCMDVKKQQNGMEKLSMDIVHTDTLTEIAGQFSIAEECSRISDLNENQTKLPDEVFVSTNPELESESKEKDNAPCRCSCTCGAKARSVGVTGKHPHTKPIRGIYNLESLLPREPDQIISIRVSAVGAVIMVDAATQVDKTFSTKEIQVGMDPEPDKDLYGNWNRICKEHSYFVN